MLVEFSLMRSAEHAADQSLDWIRRAEAIGEEGLDVEVIRRIILLSDNKTPKLNRVAESFRERLDQLAGFAQVVSSVEEELQGRLAKVVGSDPN